METYTKVDNSIIMEVMGTVEPEDLVLYIAVLSIKRDGIPLNVSWAELSRSSGLNRRTIPQHLSVLEGQGLIERNGTTITWTAHSSGVEGYFTPIANDFLAEHISPVAKVIYLKMASLKPNKESYITISQEKLTLLVKRCRETVGENIQILMGMGLVEIKERPGIKSVNQYKVKKIDITTTVKNDTMTLDDILQMDDEQEKIVEHVHNEVVCQAEISSMESEEVLTF